MMHRQCLMERLRSYQPGDWKVFEKAKDEATLKRINERDHQEDKSRKAHELERQRRRDNIITKLVASGMTTQDAAKRADEILRA